MLLNKFAVVSEWYWMLTAENECIMRIKYAASLIKKDVIVIANDGEILENFKQTGKYIKYHDIDFVINLHFSSSKGYDCYSYSVLWNPLEFYHLFGGYNSTTFNLLSHHDALSCMSDVADDHYTRAVLQYKTSHLPVELVMNHTNAGPYFAPNAKVRRKIFYCGMNHERRGQAGGRFSDVFSVLDKEDILDIYGPQKNWDGYQSYRDVIPFDGVSSFSKMSKNLLGICFSHKGHIISNMASSRIFELISAGVLPISDNNSFIKKYFDDNVLYCDDSGDRAWQIKKHYEWALSNPDIVDSMVTKLQAIVKEKFNLASQIQEIYSKHPQRRQLTEERYLARESKYIVNILYIVTKNDDLSFLVNFYQNYENIKLHIVCNEVILEHTVSLCAKNNITHQILVYPNNIPDLCVGSIIYSLQEQLPLGESQLFMVATQYDNLFYDHVSSLVRKFEDNPGVVCVNSVANRMIHNKELVCANGTYSVSNYLVKQLPEPSILKYLSYHNIPYIYNQYYTKRLQTLRVTNVFTENSLYKDSNINTESLLMEYHPYSPQSQITEAEQCLHKFLTKILRYRKKIHKIRDVLRKIKRIFGFSAKKPLDLSNIKT